MFRCPVPADSHGVHWLMSFDELDCGHSCTAGICLQQAVTERTRHVPFPPTPHPSSWLCLHVSIRQLHSLSHQ